MKVKWKLTFALAKKEKSYRNAKLQKGSWRINVANPGVTFNGQFIRALLSWALQMFGRNVIPAPTS